MKEFVFGVQSDFEQFMKLHKKDITESNIKAQKLQELINATYEQVDIVKESVERSATITTCMLEYGNIQQAIMA